MINQFIEDALFCTTPLALSYSDPNQKWVIRQHLISVFQNCSYLKPTVALFTHNDGSQVKLLAATGSLPLSPPVPLTIWVHELYPHAPPIVYVAAGPYPVYDNHPFVDPSGATTSSYLINWEPHGSNLTDLVRSLLKLFNHSHPFYHVDDHRRWSCTHYSVMSRTEAMDYLAGVVYHDLNVATAKNEVEIRRLAAVQVRLQEREESAAILEGGLDWERKRLKEKVNKVCEECVKLLSWVKVYENCNIAIDEAFEGVDKRSEEMLDSKAGNDAMEDLEYALDKAIEKGVLEFGEYMKEVRKMAREQFMWKEKTRRIQGVPLSLYLPSIT